uniref:DNA-directed RNA polymerase subunit alpha n=1 Tax=Netrium digitus TaxID=43946 RepID=A0A191T550_9VIRI|nr:alpha subunit of RNA polymerase [Netrium digitus]ANI25526.1 alpha subunit of RNA polymerase [Netrium digitus]
MSTLSINKLHDTTCRCVQDEPEHKNLLHYSRFAVSPLLAGQANTIGVAMRRALLELQGTGIRSAKILGATHEYCSLEGVLESVNDILLNLKQIVLHSTINEIQKGSIFAQGPGVVTAGHINLPQSVTVINRNQHIATLTKPSKFYIDLVIQPNKYIGQTELDLFLNDNSADSGFILDSTVSPVRNVNYSIHPLSQVYEGYELLVIEVWTNKALTPQQAIYQASENLLNLFYIFSPINSKQISTLQEQHILSYPLSVIDKSTFDLQSSSFDTRTIPTHNLDKPIDINTISIAQLQLSTRTYNCLSKANVYTIADLLKYTENDLLKIKNFGRRSVEQVKIALKNFGISLAAQDQES